MLYRKLMAVYSEIRTEHTNALCGPNAEFLNVKHCGTYRNHWARAGEPLARVKICLARGIHCCPIFILVLPVHILYIGKNVCACVCVCVCVCIYIYIYIYIYIWGNFFAVFVSEFSQQKKMTGTVRVSGWRRRQYRRSWTILRNKFDRTTFSWFKLQYFLNTSL